MCVFIKRILGFALLFSLGHPYYLCNREDESWDRATTHCYLAYGTLLTTDNLKEFYLPELIRTNFTEFWTSNVIEVAYAVEYKGCYLYSSIPTKTLLTQVEGGINLVNCQSACNNNYEIYPFYGLYGNVCVCIYKNNQFQLTPLNQSCFENRSIKSLEFCKDSKVIALYQRISNNRTILQEDNVINNKCVVQVNRTTVSTENCQKNLQYQCKKKTNNGTFLKAIQDCGKDLCHGNECSNISGLSWKPVFFPTLDRIKNQLETKQKSLKMTICKSLKVDGNHTYLKERNCTDSLPYICKTEVQKTNTTFFKTCSFRIRQTSSPSMETQLFSTRSNNHVSTMQDTRGVTLKASSGINFATTLSYIRDSTVQSSATNINYASTFSYIKETTIQSRSSTESADSGMSNKPLIIGIAIGAAAIILAVFMTFIVRKRIKRTKKKNKHDLLTVNFQAVANNTEEQDILNHQNAEPYSPAVSVSVMTESNQRNDVYAMVNKNKHADNRNEIFYSLASPVSSTSVQSKQKEGSGDIYAVVNKKETEKEEPQNNTEYDSNIDGSKIITGSDDNLFMHTGYYDNNTIVESERKPGNCVTYPLSSGTDYDHIDFRGSGNTDELSGTAGPIYDHAAVGDNSTGLIYDVRRDVERHGTDDTYDHALSL